MLYSASKSLKRMISLVVAFTLMLTLFPASLLSAEETTETWVKRYNGSGNDEDWARAIAVDTSGNVYVTGTSYATDTAQDYTTIKYDANGNELWVKSYDGPSNGFDEALAIAVDRSGNVYVTGESEGSETEESFDEDYATVKYDTNGNELWVRRYDGPADDWDSAEKIAVDATGNVYVTGISYGIETSGDYATIKYDTNGNELWVKRYNGPASGWDRARGIAVEGSDNVYVTGESDGAGTDQDYATIKYDTNGNELWVKRYNGPANGWDDAHALAVDKSANVYISGGSEGSQTWKDSATIKYDTNGNELWVKRYNGPVNGWDEANSMAVDGIGNVYVTGWSDGGETSDDYTTIKYDTNGNELWARTYNGLGNGSDVARSMAVDGIGNVYVTGWSDGGETSDDYTTIKYDTNGNELWVKRYNGPGNYEDRAEAIAVDLARNVYITGWSTGSGSFDDYATLKYTQSLSDSVPPVVTLTVPASDAMKVPPTASVTATFNEDMSPSSINTSTLTLFRGAIQITGTISYDLTTKTAIFDPTANLSYGTTYTATIKGGASGVKDLAGNPLASDYSWNFTTNYRPTADSITPTSGTTLPGSECTFAATYSDLDGWQDVSEARFLVNTSGTSTGGLQVRYSQNANKLYLRNDTNTTWLGGYLPGSTNPDGSDKFIENSYAKLNVTNTLVSGSGNTLTVTWKLTFKDAFSGRRYYTYLYVKDDQGANSGWVKKGTFTVNRPPTVGTITPSSGSGPAEIAQLFTATYSDSDGWDKSSGAWMYSASEGWKNITEAKLLVNTLVSGANAIYVYYNQNSNKLYLRNDTNTSWLGGFTPGSSNTIENSYGKLNVAATSVSGSGTTLTVNWNITPKPIMSGKTYNTYLYAKDDAYASTGWKKKGTWGVL